MIKKTPTTVDISQSIFLDRFQGLLVGTAVGDSLGLPREGLSAGRAGKLFGPPNRHCFFFGRGMISDDTDHSVFVAQSLLQHPSSVTKFERRMAWALRWWLLSLPAGIGMATLRSILRYWIGFKPGKAGVYSAGNGAAMRSAPIGAFFYDKPDLMNEYVGAGSRLTHTDPRAEIGARAVAAIAAFSVRCPTTERPSQQDFIQLLADADLDCTEWTQIVEASRQAVTEQLTVRDFAASISRKGFVSGYVFHTVPVVAYAWFRHFGDFASSLETVLDCGGDADTTGAIIGALAGGTVGFSGIPAEWINGVADWPRSVGLCKKIGEKLAEAAQSRQPSQPVRYFWPGTIVRNVIFLFVVLFHGFRRMFPPY